MPLSLTWSIGESELHTWHTGSHLAVVIAEQLKSQCYWSTGVVELGSAIHAGGVNLHSRSFGMLDLAECLCAVWKMLRVRQCLSRVLFVLNWPSWTLYLHPERDQWGLAKAQRPSLLVKAAVEDEWMNVVHTS